jgi:hypothetical protein
MKKFPCPYLNGDVELTDEREAHIAEMHPDLLPEYLLQLAQTLEDLDEVRQYSYERCADVLPLV